MGEMATGERSATDVVKAVGAVIALLAGSVALLYIAGGAAMTLRLFLYGLPSLNVAAQLPLEILISVDGWNTLSSAGAMSLIVAPAAVPACFVFAATFRLLDAKVCRAGDSAMSGRLIGELSDRIYLGETGEDPWPDSDVPSLRVVSIPKAKSTRC